MAIICEMFHTSSLLHDDVIDHAETRRGKVSVNTKWSQASSIQASIVMNSKIRANTKYSRVLKICCKLDSKYIPFFEK